MHMTRRWRGFGSAALLLLTVSLSACGGDTATTGPAATAAGGATVAIGTAPTTTAGSTVTTTRAAATGMAVVATGTTALSATSNSAGATTTASGATITTAGATMSAAVIPATSGSAVAATRPAGSVSPASPAAMSTTAASAAPAVMSTTAASAAPATTGSAPAGTTRAAAGATMFNIVSDQSEASYTVNEKFANIPAPNDAVGKTNQITGQIALTSDGKVADSGKITVNVMSLTSDRSQRDNYIRKNSLESSMFPDAVIMITSAEGLNAPLGGSPTQFKLIGTMTIHGVTKPITWDTTASMTGDTINGNASTTFKMGDFNIMPPMVAILSTSDTVKLDMKITAKKAA